MLEVKKILFALDLVDISTDIAPWANLMAEKFEAEIHLLHVVPDMAGVGFPYAVVPGTDMDAMLASARNKTDAFKDAHIGKDRPVNVSVVPGNPAEQILTYIENNRISIVVMGTHGRRGLDRVIFGSVADRVLKTSPVPVLCVNPFRNTHLAE